MFLSVELLMFSSVFSQLRSIWLCAFLLSDSPMTENHVLLSAQLPHPFQPNVFVQMFWKEQRQPRVRGTGAPPPLEVSHAAPQIGQRHRCPSRLLLRRLRPKERQQVSAPSVAARGVLHLTMMAIPRAPAPAVGGFSRLGFRAALSPPRDDRVPMTPSVSLPPGLQSPPAFRCWQFAHWLPPSRLPIAASC